MAMEEHRRMCGSPPRRTLKIVAGSHSHNSGVKPEDVVASFTIVGLVTIF
jgi:hypothetical protein